MNQSYITSKDNEGRDQVADRLRAQIAEAQKCLKENRINGAFVLYIDIVSEASEKLGDHDILTLDAKSYLAEMLHTNREFYGAMKLNQEVLGERERYSIQRSSHWKTIWTRNNLARNFSAMGLLNKAEILFRENSLYLDRQEKESLEQDNSTLGIFQDLAIREYGQERYEEAEELFRELLSRKASPNEEMQSKIVENRLYLAATLCKLDRAEEALEHLEKNITILKEAVQKNLDSLDKNRRLAERCHEALEQTQNASFGGNSAPFSMINSVPVSPGKTLSMQEEMDLSVSELSWPPHQSESRALNTRKVQGEEKRGYLGSTSEPSKTLNTRKTHVKSVASTGSIPSSGSSTSRRLAKPVSTSLPRGLKGIPQRLTDSGRGRTELKGASKGKSLLTTHQTKRHKSITSPHEEEPGGRQPSAQQGGAGQVINRNSVTDGYTQRVDLSPEISLDMGHPIFQEKAKAFLHGDGDWGLGLLDSNKVGTEEELRLEERSPHADNLRGRGSSILNMVDAKDHDLPLKEELELMFHPVSSNSASMAGFGHSDNVNSDTVKAQSDNEYAAQPRNSEESAFDSQPKNFEESPTAKNGLGVPHTLPMDIPGLLQAGKTVVTRFWTPPTAKARTTSPPTLKGPSSWDSKQPTAQTETRSGKRNTTLSSHSIAPSLRQLASQLHDAMDCDPNDHSYSRIIKLADDWFKQDENLPCAHELVDQARKDDDINQVRVCILDTGIDGGHLYLTNGERDYGDRIKGCIAWNKDKKLQTYPEYSKWRTLKQPKLGGYEDEDGHGTHCAGLVLEVAPNSHLYLARVIRNRNEPIDPTIVNEAINYATNEWKVDIISMSFGFSNSIPIVEKAVRYATGRKVIIFAAAANHGGNRNYIAFPASMESVICIKSADGDGKSSDFNPANTEDAGLNFSTLGEGVLSMWPMKKGRDGIIIPGKRQSGSSVATPIAAGIAALLLEFSRQPDDKPEYSYLEESREKLKSGEGMKKLFRYRKMSQMIGNCRYVVPWILLNSQLTGPQIPGHSDRSQAALRIWSCLHE